MTLKENVHSLGIVGFGTFGRFMLKYLSPHFDSINIYDKNTLAEISYKTSKVKFTSKTETLQSDVIILAIPVQYLESFLQENSELFNPKAIVLDVCSVKIIPSELMLKYLPQSVQVLATHPLFGPFSGKNGIRGLKIMLHNLRVEESSYQEIKEFLSKDLELEVLEFTPEFHDQQMAYVQALTFFLGKSVNAIDAPDSILKTPTYQHLLELKEVVGKDTNDLFFTIQKFNPYAKKIRQEFMENLQNIEKLIEEK